MEFIQLTVATEEHTLKIVLHVETTVEDILLEACEKLNIKPVARHLFAIRVKSNKSWLNLNCKLNYLKPFTNELELRVRFNLPHLNRLLDIDKRALDYFFRQVRYEVLNNKIAALDYKRYEREILGMCVVDMYRATMEDGLSKEQVCKEYKKYIPKCITRKHPFYIRKPVMKAFDRVKIPESADPAHAKYGYLDQFEKIAAGYMSEKFSVLLIETNCSRYVTLIVDPFDKEYPGMRYHNEDSHEISVKKDEQDIQYYHMCTIEDLCYINIREDCCVEISRKNGIALHFKFPSASSMTSFVTLLDGYYRLMVKWTFNLCAQTIPPSLQRLSTLKCHGPINGEFAYRKLEEKRNNEFGCYIIRESNLAYDCYYIDVCVRNSSKPVTRKIDTTKDGRYRLEGDDELYFSLGQLISNYRCKDRNIVLQECLPPSEFDQSNLLICQKDNYSITGSDAKDDVKLPTAPLCIDTRSLMVFKNMPQLGRCPITAVYRGVWRRDKTTKYNVAIKVLKESYYAKCLSEFLSLTSRWAFVNSNAVVKLYGVTLSNPVSMVMEYMNLGQLDSYLANVDSRPPIAEVDLVEAITYLANALWYLEEAGFVHGYIRCRKLLVASHTDNSFVVKLSDPGPYRPFKNIDMHWIPPEHYNDLDKARNSVMADVWSFGTTLWEIFSYGKSPPHVDANAIRKFYGKKKCLPKPAGCPDMVYHLMLDCWCFDPQMRKKPQAIMRDTNQILYQVYNSRKVHSYATVAQPFEAPAETTSLQSFSTMRSDELNSSLLSEMTLNTFLDEDGEEVDACVPDLFADIDNDAGSNLARYSKVYRCTTDKDEMLAMVSPRDDVDSDTYDEDDDQSSCCAIAKDSLYSIQSIFQLDKEWNLILTGRIGEGFYGEVYRGRLDHMYNEKEPKMVAVKKMKAHALPTSKADFDREISILLKLQHPNIVQIKGVVEDPELCLVLEYVENGSLLCYLKIHRDRLTPQHLLKFALDVAQGMIYLGNMKIIHRDLAARNILVANGSTVKISDFGLARSIDDSNYYMFQTERDLPIKWYAPESLEFWKFSVKSDVWSYGVTLFEMFSFGEEPNLPGMESHTLHMICSTLKNGTRLPCPKTCPQYVYAQIMSPCWRHQAKDRPSFQRLVALIKQIFTPATAEGGQQGNAATTVDLCSRI